MSEQNDELQLQIQTIEFTPALVAFNADQISTVLDAQLAKYKGLTFTEDDEAAAKKTVAELNKGKKLLDTYRKDMKAKLTLSVTDFENKIKELSKKFDDVIGPLTEQTAQFETDRKAKKRVEIESLISALRVEYELSEKFAPQLVFPEEYLNRSTSIKSIQLELRAKANQLRNDQDRLASELELIRGKVEIANLSLLGGGMLETTYIQLLGPLTLQQVLARIAVDAAALLERETQAAAREAAAAEAKQKAADLAATKQKEAEAAAAAAAAARIESPPVQSPPPVSTIKTVQAEPTAPEAPLGPGARTYLEQSHAVERCYVERYKITGTTAQLDAVETYLNQLGCKWEIIE